MTPISIYNNDFVINQGNVTISTSANDTYFEAQFGNSTSTPPTPGLVIAPDGSLSSLYAAVCSNISAQNLTINATNLTFESYGNNGTFEIPSGSVCMSSGPLQFASAEFGCAVYSEPGLEIVNGTLTQLNINISSNMSVENMTLNISNLDLVYEQVPNQTDGLFQIADGGSVNLSTGAANNTLTFNGTFGSPSNVSLPGLCISDGQLQSFDIGVTTNISLGGSLDLNTTNLTFSYNESNQTFGIASGSVSLNDTSGDFNFTGTFGGNLSNGTTARGLVVTDGTLTQLDISVTSQLEAAGLTMNVTNLDFCYNSTGNQYEIDSGNLSFSTSEGFSFSADFGLPDPSNSSVNLPGLVISGGSLTEFNAALYANFTVAGLIITVNDMAMIYSAGEYEMYGTVLVNTTNFNFNGTIGQPTASPPVPGLIIDNGSLIDLNITVNSNVTLGASTVNSDESHFQLRILSLRVHAVRQCQPRASRA